MDDKISFIMIAVFSAGVYLLFLTGEANRRKRVFPHMKDTDSRIYIWKDQLLRELRSMQKKRQNKVIDDEVHAAISFLRNMIAIDRGKQVSTDFIIEELSQKQGVLQNTYIKMLSLLRVNRRAEAQQLMAEELETPIGKEFAGLLLKWDEIDPSELTEILLSHQKSIKEIRMTRQRRKDETISDVLYFPVIINVVMIFINFIYVGYFINQKQVLQMLF